MPNISYCTVTDIHSSVVDLRSVMLEINKCMFIYFCFYVSSDITTEITLAKLYNRKPIRDYVISLIGDNETPRAGTILATTGGIQINHIKANTWYTLCTLIAIKVA